VAGEKKTEHCLFAVEGVALGPVGNQGKGGLEALTRIVLLRAAVKKGELAGGSAVVDTLGVVDRLLDSGEFLRPGSRQRVHRSGLDEAFKHLFVQRLQVDGADQIDQALEAALLFTASDDRLDGAAADILDRPEAEADASFGDDEIGVAFVHIRGQNLQPHAPALLEQDHHPRGGAHFTAQVRRHEFGRIVDLEKTRLIGHQRVTGGMGFVETVAGELGHHVIDLVGDLVEHTALVRSLDEMEPLPGHDLEIFFPHRAAEQVGVAERKTAHLRRHLDHLLLIDRNAVGLLEQGGEQGMEIGDRSGIALAADEIVDIIHGPGTIEGIHGDEVFQAGGLELTQILLHAGTFKLEKADGFTPGEDLIDPGVVERDGIDVDLDAPGCNGLDRLLDHRQGAQSEKIHLEQTHLLQRLHVVLGGDVAFLGLVERHIVGQLFRCDEHAGGMGGGVPRQTLQDERMFDQAAAGLILLGDLAQLGDVLDRLLELDLELLRHQLGDAVHIGIVYLENPSDIADDGPRCHGAEGDDLADVVVAVLFLDVADDLFTALIAEIDVDVRHRDALGIEKTLEDQVIADRIEVGDLEHIGDQAAGGRTAAGSHRDVLAAGITDEIGGDEKIARIAHLPDDLKLILQPLLQIRRHLRIAFAQAGPRHLGEVIVQILAGVFGWKLENRQVKGPRIKMEVALFRHLERIEQSLGMIGKGFGHLRFTLEIELPGGIAHAGGILEILARLQTEQDIVGFGMPFFQIVDIVGGDHLDIHLPGDGKDGVADGLFFGDAVVLDFEVEILAEDVAIFGDGRTAALLVLAQQPLADLALEAGAEGDQPLVMFAQQGAVDAGLVIKSFQISGRDQLHQVLVAGHVLAEQDQMKSGAAGAGIGLLLQTAARSHIDFGADQGFDFGLAALFIKADDAMHAAVVGQSDCRHALRFRPLDEILDAAGAVEKAVMGVVMEMDKPAHAETLA